MGDENVEQEISTSNVIRHYCKVCNRGFGCAGALGGHMRAHVMGDVGDVNSTMKVGSNNKHSYFLRAKTPRALTSFDHVTSDGDVNGLDHIERVSNFVDMMNSSSNEDEDLANCLVMLSSNKKGPKEVLENNNNNKGIFQCKACKKVFNSHQALGGHRASHKKVKGCFAAKLDDEENENHVDGGDSIQEDHRHQHHEYYAYSLEEAKNMSPKMHECSVCRRVFSSGQALGGHKRCHWLTTSTSDNSGFNIPSFQYDHQLLYKNPMFTNPSHDQQLDLNLNLHGQNIENYSKGDVEMNRQQCTIDLKQPEKSEMKLRKLSDLRDMNLDGGWLQMGIASTTDII